MFLMLLLLWMLLSLLLLLLMLQFMMLKFKIVWKTSKVLISDFLTFDHLKKCEFKLFRKSFDRLNRIVLTSRFDHLTFDLSTPSPH